MYNQNNQYPSVDSQPNYFHNSATMYTNNHINIYSYSASIVNGVFMYKGDSYGLKNKI
jgi:hypothetical protein